jgi:hypothetical protein
MPQEKHLVRQYPRAPQGLVRMLSTFNVVDATPYKRDIVKGLADACARHHMPFGVYYSTIDWHFGDPPDRRNDNPISEAHEEFNVAQLRELMTGYGPSWALGLLFLEQPLNSKSVTTKATDSGLIVQTADCT